MDTSQHEPPDDPDRPTTGSLVFAPADPGRLLAPEQFNDLRQSLGALASHLMQEEVAGEVRIALVNDAAMAELHERHTGVPGTTDVLTFDLAGTGKTSLDVDLTVCVDQAGREARSRGIPVVHELVLYIIHGVLHCVGYDDHTCEGDFGADAMHRREDEILHAIGIGPVYSVPEQGDRR